MKEGKAKFENKGLIILLCVLVVAIVGLVVGIVLLKGGGEEVVVVDEPFEEQVLYDEYVSYVDDYNAVRAEAKNLLGQDPVDVDAIVDLYNQYINQNIANNELDRASSYMYAEYEDLLAGGFKQEALDALVVMDFSVFNEPEQYRWYSIVVSLANELGNGDVVLQYEPLMAQTKAAYDANYAAAEAAAREGEQAVQGNQEEGV